ncbi:hypothetical protein AAVH_18813 [Aphelenchoides avenae]|nr:hypothetical protein AAVH_18813 [Aphelenchus avenae]
MTPTSTLSSHNDTAAAASVPSPSTAGRGSVSVTPASELYRPNTSTYNGAATKMFLPSENVLDVLHCVDFATLLAAQRSGSAFYDVVRRNRSILPRLRVFDFYLDLARGDLILQEIVEDADSTLSASWSVVPFTDEFDYSTLQPLTNTVGTNFVNSAIIANSRGPMEVMAFDMRKAVEVLPALKHVRELTFECRCLMHTTYTVDIETLVTRILSPLDNLQCLKLAEVFNENDWAFLRNEWALRLRSLFVEADSYFGGYPKINASGEAEILEYCTDFAHLEKGKSKKLTIIGWQITSEFLQRIIATVSECKDWLTVVVDGAPDYVGNDTDYARSDVPAEDPELPWSVGFVRYSARDGSHRIFVQTDPPFTIAVTNNPFITTWSDLYEWDIDGF